MIVKNTMNGFLLMCFSGNHELQKLQAMFLLMTYLLGSAGNFIIITITTLDPQLQSPMYYFLKHLSILDLSSLSVTVPQYVDSSLAGCGYISYGQCMLQIFFFTALSCSEMAILSMMSYDHYVAICLPLHYEVIMSPRKCTWAVAAVWLSGGISGMLNKARTLSIRFRGDRIIHQIFCDIPQLLKLSCSNDQLVTKGVADFLSAMAFACFIEIVFIVPSLFANLLLCLSRMY